MNFYVIGDVTVDHLYHLDHIPRPGEEVAPIRSNMQPGGAGGTMSVTLARLGHRVILAARVGKDPFAEVALKLVREAGVDLRAVQVDPDLLTSTITVMQTPDGQRAMISAGAANRLLDAAQLKRHDLDQVDGLLVSAYSLIGGAQREFATKAIGLAKKAAIPVFIDMGAGASSDPASRLLESVLSADYLLLNQRELLALTETDNISEALLRLQDRGVERVVIKVGAMGSIVWTPQETELVEAVNLDADLVDSTGSGDTFSAVFAHAVLSGKTLRQAARAANAAGAISATAVGAQSRAITAQDLLAHLS